MCRRKTLVDVLSTTPFQITKGREFTTLESRGQELTVLIQPGSRLPAFVFVEYVGAGHMAGSSIDARFTARGQKYQLEQAFKQRKFDVLKTERLTVSNGQGFATTIALQEGGTVCVWAAKGNYSGKDNFGDGSRGHDLLVEALHCGSDEDRATLMDYVAKARLTSPEANSAALARRKP